MRKILLTIHRWLGIVFGILISLVCLTGAMLVFQTEILQGLNSDLYNLEIPADGKCLSDTELAARVLEQLTEGQMITFIQVSDEPGVAAQANIAGMGQKNLFVNPYTGDVLGYPKYTEFFDTVKSLHRWLLNKPENHQQGTLSPGRVIIGITAIAMSLILLTGIWLWWPKSRKMLKNRLKVCTSKGFRRFVYDSHVSLGIYAVVFLLLMSLTGPTWSFPWYKSAAQTILLQGEEQRVDGHQQGGKHEGHGGPMMHHQEKGDNGQPQGQRPEDVGVMHFSGAQQQHGGGFHMLISSLHFGRWAGWFSKLIYLLAALIGVLLPWSGYYMWYKRTRTTTKKA